MGEITPHQGVLLIVAAFSRYDEALDWAKQRCREQFGPLGLESAAFAFTETDYYQPTMGPGLRKTFWAFEKLRDPAELVEWKLETNAWEEEYARRGDHAEPRPLNLDPGYITLGKLVLASTKDHSHRIYLDRGIYAEVTLSFQGGAWRHHEKTFRDYRRADYQEFFSRCREYLKQRRRASGDSS
jgi:hypothetical protein